jgi:NAD(P)-dependent dehydrogenase (short-subunit alcohol dehydrogenase family)
MTRLLEGDTALITGAGNNIGRAVALAFAREGARVLATDVSPERGAALIAAAGDLPVTFVPADLASRPAAAALADHAMATLGAVSVFVHCASPPRPETQTVMDVTEPEFDAMHEVNVRAGFTLGRLIGRRMVESRIAGRMLYVTSLHADTPRNLPHYSSAKAGMTMVMKEFARALGPHGIRVNALAPGAILGGGSSTAADPRLLSMIALKRPGTADEIADMALVLCADRFSRYVTGTTVVVDGGISLTNWIEPFTA